MKIQTIKVTNFRLLKDVTLTLEDYTTVIVGRNNSGKTSLTEIFRRLLGAKAPVFSLYDFSIPSIDGFKRALKAKLSGKTEEEIRAEIPAIQIKLTIEYPIEQEDLGMLSNFIIDINVDSNTAIIVVQYTLRGGKIDSLFDGIEDESPESIKVFIKSLKEKIPSLFETRIFAQDPDDEDNILMMDHSKLKSVIGAGFINAQRGLDDETHTEKDVLGKVLGQLFDTSRSETAPEDMKQNSEALNDFIATMQRAIDTDFNGQLNNLLPALSLFGYPSISDSKLSTETTIDIGNILNRHTKVRYAQGEHIFLPETYNGLGTRNLIYMLLQLYEFFRQYQSRPVTNSLDVVFIEEPEAHLHPQMQQIFISKLYKIADEFSKRLNNGKQWPVQFIVTTHSTHIANEAPFEAIRYFLTSNNEQKETTVKDLRQEFTADDVQEDKEFLHKYLTLTKCDLYFADKAILIEGMAERIMMPRLISKSDAVAPDNPSLGLQYLTIIEVGGAYAHHFYKFLDFLELRCLIITDLDSVASTVNDKGRTVYPRCLVATGTHTSNAAIKNWFAKDTVGHYSLPDCIAKKEADKIDSTRRIAFQIPEDGLDGTGRSFEEAFLLANRDKYGITGDTSEEIEQSASDKAEIEKKSEFALKNALEDTDWNAPKYIIEGLQWLAKNPNAPAEEVIEAAEEITP